MVTWINLYFFFFSLSETSFHLSASTLRNCLFWEQIDNLHTFTCDSVIPKAYASFARSGPARYLVCSNVFSNAKICWPLNVGRVCFFLPSLSELWCCDRLADTVKLREKFELTLKNMVELSPVGHAEWMDWIHHGHNKMIAHDRRK